MKKLLVLFAMNVVFSNLNAQQSCCAKLGSTETFAMLTRNEKFVATHLDPKPFILQNQLGRDISIKSADGQDAHAYELKSEKSTNLYVIVIHEWWGLNDYIKQESEKIFKNLGNVNVIAIDLYDKKIATNKDSAAKYMQSVKTERAQNIIKSVVSYLGKDAKIATIGWCFGGGWSMQASLIAGAQSKACVMYYGMPEENMDKLKTLSAPVYFIWPELDQWINKAVVDKFETNMKAAKKRFAIKSYDANHAFANPSNPLYNQDIAEDAFKNAMAFIQTNLK